MLEQVNGLPTHVLVVHAVVVLLPLTALAVVLAAWWPAARARLGVVLPLLAAASLALVPVTTQAGQWLRERVGNAPLVERHVRLGQQLLPWTVALLVVSVVVWLRGRGTARGPSKDAAPVGARPAEASSVRQPSASGATSPSLLATALVGVLATAVAVGTVVQVARIGESGSRAVWQGVVDSSR